MSTKIRKPYEILIRFDAAGAVAGAHTKFQTYYATGDGDAAVIDAETWREEMPTEADLQSPEMVELLNQCGMSLAAQLAAANATIGRHQSEIEQLTSELAARTGRARPEQG